MAIGLSTGESFEDMFDATYMPPQSNMSIGTRSDTERALIDDEQYASLHQDTAATPLTPMPSRALKADIEARRDVSEQDTGQLGGGNFVPGMHFAAGSLPRGAPAPSPTISIEQDPRRTDWPNQEDVAMSRKYELDYGDPSARYVNPGIANMATIPWDKVPIWSAERRKADSRRDLDINTLFDQTEINQDTADYINRTWLASRQDPVSQLGFDWGHTVASRSDTSYMLGSGDNMETRGFYDFPAKDPKDPDAPPKYDKMWTNSRYETNILHESIHRGLHKLSEQKLIPPLDSLGHETLTRLILDRKFRHAILEDQQVPAAYLKDLEMYKKVAARRGYDLDKIEKIAADYIAKKRPMGPR